VPAIRFQVLYVFLVLAHGQQLRKAFPFDQLPRYLLRDRDAIFGDAFREQVRDVGICEVLSAPRSPWQSLRGASDWIDSTRVPRSCDRVPGPSIRIRLLSPIENTSFLGERLTGTTSHSASGNGSVVAVPQVGGLHHRYERRAA
jgi:putative transposase